MALSFKPIRSLLQTGSNRWSRLFAYAGLALGVLLLLCAIQMYINIHQMVTQGNIRKNGFDYVPITKNMTTETLRSPEKNLFTQQNIDEIKKQPFIEDAAPLIANQFRIQLSAGKLLPFQTEFFIESLKNDFIDTIPPSFTWQEGQQLVPIIFSSDFFEIYTVFAAGQDLPKIPKETAVGFTFLVTCYGNGQQQEFIGKIVALSDRVNSVLVPESFLDWANKTFGQGTSAGASRIFIKTKDANSASLLSFLDSKDYVINKEQTLLGRNKMVLQSIVSGLGIFGLVVVILALMLFSFYLQLVIARSKDNLSLLLTLGYSPSWLSSKVSGRFLPVYIIIVLLSLALTQLIQWSFYHFVMQDKAELSPFVHWSLLLAAAALILLSLFTNYRMVRKMLYQFYKQ